MRHTVKAEPSKAKKEAPHRVVIKRIGNGVTVQAHHEGPMVPMGMPGSEPQEQAFTKMGPLKKHLNDHLAAMMPSDNDGDEQGGGAPMEKA